MRFRNIGALLAVSMLSCAGRDQARAWVAGPMTSMAEIRRHVALRFGLEPRELLERSRARRIARPRQVGMYLAYQGGRRSRELIGRHFGGLTPWTVLHACRQVERLCVDDPTFAQTVGEIERELQA